MRPLALAPPMRFKFPPQPERPARAARSKARAGPAGTSMSTASSTAVSTVHGRRSAWATTSAGHAMGSRILPGRLYAHDLTVISERTPALAFGTRQQRFDPSAHRAPVKTWKRDTPQASGATINALGNRPRRPLPKGAVRAGVALNTESMKDLLAGGSPRLGDMFDLGGHLGAWKIDAIAMIAL